MFVFYLRARCWEGWATWRFHFFQKKKQKEERDEGPKGALIGVWNNEFRKSNRKIKLFKKTLLYNKMGKLDFFVLKKKVYFENVFQGFKNLLLFDK